MTDPPSTTPLKANPIPSESKPTKKQLSPSELLSSAKLVVEAAKSTLNHDSDHKVDKKKVAHASGDLLGAASHHGKLKDKGYGKYLGQAENYLHKYGQKNSHSAAHNSDHSANTTAQSSSHHSDDHGKSGSGYGDYLKMAKGIFNKH